MCKLRGNLRFLFHPVFGLAPAEYQILDVCSTLLVSVSVVSMLIPPSARTPPVNLLSCFRPLFLVLCLYFRIGLLGVFYRCIFAFYRPLGSERNHFETC